MAYDEEQHKKSRVVIETPTERREAVRTVVARAPERRGVSAGVVAALVIGSVALVTVLFLFIINNRSDGTSVTSNSQTATTGVAPTPVQPVVIQQPTPPPPQQPIIIQQAPPTDQPPVIIQQPAPAAPAASAGRPSGTDDASIQSEIDKKMTEDTNLSNVTATVLEGKVTLIGTVDSEAIKNRAERLAKGIKGVKSVDNQLVVVSSG